MDGANDRIEFIGPEKTLADTLGILTDTNPAVFKWPEAKSDEDRRRQAELAGRLFNTGNCVNLLRMPVKRDVKLRETMSTGAAPSLNLNRKNSVEAALLTSRGEVKRGNSACYHCTKSSGPFAECCVSENFIKGACNNCHNGADARRCTFHEESKSLKSPAKKKFQLPRDSNGPKRTVARLEKLATRVLEDVTDMKAEIRKLKGQMRDDTNDDDMDTD